jgi:hypothetical protein
MVLRLVHDVRVAANSPLDYLVEWFSQHCDGDWEHDLGITIATLDNPGWSVDVRIADTDLEGPSTDWHKDETNENTWVHWRSTGQMFEARCGPDDLTRALAAFRSFASGATS